MKIPLPENEIERLHRLYSFQILDTESSEEFDDLTAIASTVCQTPIALISLLDDHRQWFLSKIGLEVSETPREISFCTHAIVNPEQTFIVPDAMKDERFVNNPLVTKNPNIRFYAGAPLVTRDGMALGTLCVIDNQARTLSDEQEKILTILSRRVTRAIEKNLLFIQMHSMLHNSLNATNDIIAICDTIGEALYVNQQFVEVFGINEKQIAQRGGIEILFQEPEEWADILSTVVTGNWSGAAHMRLQHERMGFMSIVASIINSQELSQPLIFLRFTDQYKTL